MTFDGTGMLEARKQKRFVREPGGSPGKGRPMDHRGRVSDQNQLSFCKEVSDLVPMNC